MADDGAPIISTSWAKRVFFLSPGEPKDAKTLEALVGAALLEVREDLWTDAKAARLLAVIGRTGRERHIKALEGLIADRIAERLHNPPQRQRVHPAWIRFDSVPQPRRQQVLGTLRIKAWGHSLRSTFAADIGT